MNYKKILLMGVIFFLAVGLILSGCGKKTTTTPNTSVQNVNTKTDEAPYTLVGNTKIFALQLVNSVFEYTKMTFLAGDTVKVTLAENGTPVDFEFVNPNVKSTDGEFVTSIQNNDQGGTYQLVCQERECGTINVTVVPLAITNTNSSVNTNASSNTNSAANTNSASSITKVELQRLPKGTDFSPNVNMATTNSFAIGDNFGFGVTGTFATGAKLTFAILDSKGAVVEPQGMQFNLMNGTNGNCCFGLPQTAGSYNIKFYVNGHEGYNAPITVSE